MYSYKERKTAVKLYIKYGRRAARVIKELGYCMSRECGHFLGLNYD